MKQTNKTKKSTGHKKNQSIIVAPVVGGVCICGGYQQHSLKLVLPSCKFHYSHCGLDSLDRNVNELGCGVYQNYIENHWISLKRRVA